MRFILYGLLLYLIVIIWFILMWQLIRLDRWWLEREKKKGR